MHAVFISFQSTAKEEELAEPFSQYAQALRNGAIPGFISKTWLSNGATMAGFHLFEDREAADRYLTTMFASAVPSNPAFSDIRIERYDVDEETSAITNGVPARAPATA